MSVYARIYMYMYVNIYGFLCVYTNNFFLRVRLSISKINPHLWHCYTQKHSCFSTFLSLRPRFGAADDWSKVCIRCTRQAATFSLETGSLLFSYSFIRPPFFSSEFSLKFQILIDSPSYSSLLFSPLKQQNAAILTRLDSPLFWLLFFFKRESERKSKTTNLWIKFCLIIIISYNNIINKTRALLFSYKQTTHGKYHRIIVIRASSSSSSLLFLNSHKKIKINFLILK